jgi:hypothetical protein
MKTNQSVAEQATGDFTLTGSGTVYLFCPLTQTARDWLARFCPAGGDHQYFADCLAIEARYVSNIVIQAAMAGLKPLENSSNEQR